MSPVSVVNQSTREDYAAAYDLSPCLYLSTVCYHTVGSDLSVRVCAFLESRPPCLTCHLCLSMCSIPPYLTRVCLSAPQSLVTRPLHLAEAAAAAEEEVV